MVSFPLSLVLLLLLLAPIPAVWRNKHLDCVEDGDCTGFTCGQSTCQRCYNLSIESFCYSASGASKPCFSDSFCTTWQSCMVPLGASKLVCADVNGQLDVYENFPIEGDILRNDQNATFSERYPSLPPLSQPFRSQSPKATRKETPKPKQTIKPSPKPILMPSSKPTFGQTFEPESSDIDELQRLDSDGNRIISPGTLGVCRTKERM